MVDDDWDTICHKADKRFWHRGKPLHLDPDTWRRAQELRKKLDFYWDELPIETVYRILNNRKQAERLADLARLEGKAEPRC